ncbi:MAG: gliding motility-associated C-terminal domain-containing protein [Bacteroidota bacterium]
MKHISIYIILLTFLLLGTDCYASHYRAGEITYAQVSGRRYRITATTYTDPQSQANQFTGTVTIVWGDGTSNVVTRTSLFIVSTTAQRNTYEFEHEYQSDGVFIISLTDPNRVDGIFNINGGQSGNTPFYVESMIRISSTIGNNQSPILTVPPLVDGCLQFLYLHNPGAYDPDGDSLAYTLSVPKQGTNNPVPNYETPRTSDSFAIDPFDGTLYWAKSIAPGIYNIAVKVSEFRNGQLVGFVIRDMQIRIRDCINDIPVLTTISNRCVVAGDSLSIPVSATDINVQKITLLGFGAPFKVPNSPAILKQDPGLPNGLASGHFLWKTNCSHIRHSGYQTTIEAKDDYAISNGAGYTTFDVKVNGPAPQNVQTKQLGNGFRISWSKDVCQLANRYKVYRRIDSSFWNHGTCETGIPASTGFTLIGEVKSNVFATTDTSFYDDNKGEGLSPLVNYCYRIVAVFPPRSANGTIIGGTASESYASIEVCDIIIRSKPIIIEASVTTTHAINGALKLSWIRPDTLDTIVYKAPYRLVFKRAVYTPASTGPYTIIGTADYGTFAGISDSSLTDSNLNTLNNQYIYKIELLYDSLGFPAFVDVSPTAASIYTKVYSTDNTNILTVIEKVPWTNNLYTIYRKNPVTSLFDSLASTQSRTFSDTGLINGVSYCYYIRSRGAYSFYNSILLNNSQEICGIPLDTVRPCPPLLTVTPPCNVFNDSTNKLSWIPKPVCADDVVSYNIYYKKLFTDPFVKIAGVNSQTLNYTDNREALKFSIAGCYSVTGVDSFNNESFLTDSVCIDNCPYYEIPNVFTPNGDGKNDLLKPFPYRFIDHIKLRIYNRWGQMVYETDNLNILWDGKDLDSKSDCSDGVYFYTCEVFEQYLLELKTRSIRGTIQLIRE